MFNLMNTTMKHLCAKCFFTAFAVTFLSYAPYTRGSVDAASRGNAARGSATAYLDELQMYVANGRLQRKKDLDIMQPSSTASAESNLQVLLEVLRDAELLETLERVKAKTCDELKATTCRKHFEDLLCQSLSISGLRSLLTRAEAEINSGEGAVTACIDSVRLGLMLFDLTVVTEPLRQFQSSPSAGPEAALRALFSSLSIGIPQASTTGAPTSNVEPAGHTEATALLEIGKLKSRQGKYEKLENLTQELSPVAGILNTILVTSPASYLAFAGAGGPISSLILNWFYQAFSRFDEFFGVYEGKRRPLAPLLGLLAAGHELKLTHLNRMCGIALGPRRQSARLLSNALFLPREQFRRRTRLAGLQRVSCDVMTQAAYTLHLAEMNAHDHLNNLKHHLPSEQLQYAVPLELNAGGLTNFQRLCYGFRGRRESNLLQNLFCSYDDTVLGSIEAEAAGVAAPSTSFAESAGAEEWQREKNVANQNAQLAFWLVDLRAGNWGAAAYLLGANAGPWWSLLMAFDSRKPDEIVNGFKNTSRRCKGVVKRLGPKLARADEEALSCSSTWEEKKWSKGLHCASKLAGLQCAASLGLYNIFESGMTEAIGLFLQYLSKEAACGPGTEKCSKSSWRKQAPLTTIRDHPVLFSRGIRLVPAAENLLRVFLMLSGNSWKNSKELLQGADGIDKVIGSFAAVVAARKTSLLLSRWVPRTLAKFMKAHKGRKYSRRLLRFLESRLPVDFYLKLRACINVLVHPMVFLHLNQLNFTRSDPSGARGRSGGLSQQLDNLMVQAATKGLPQKIKEKLQAGEKTTPKDFNHINFSLVDPPKVSSWQDLVKLALLDHIGSWLMHPASTERIYNECPGGGLSNILSLFRDSLELLGSSESENLTLIGKVVSPKETSIGRPGFLKRALAKFFRLPPYKVEHHLFVAVTVDIQEAMAAIRSLVNVYTQNEGIFENQEVFANAVLDLFAHYEQHNRMPSRGLLGVPESVLVSMLHPQYASMATPDRLREFKDSAMGLFFCHIWTLLFSVSANNLLNAGNLSGLEKTFSKEAWQKSVNDPFQASSFGMVLMGGDLGLTLFNQLLPTSQKRMLKRARFGSPTVFASQMQLAASLLSASGYVGLGLFLHAQSVYFGVMIRQWIQKRTQDRLREIVSWLTLGLFFASSFLQVTDGVTQMASTGNETGQASMGASCPPMGVCIDSQGNAFVPDPMGSAPLTALQALLKAGIMTSVAVAAGPVLAFYNIAVSNFQILSRMEMALGSVMRRLMTRISESKAVKNIRRIFKAKQDREGKKIAKARANKSVSLGDDVEDTVLSFFQNRAVALRQRS